ncbi:MAG TPA: bifunctional DNA-formamidopyrimidine glycosylase/DNA-(apurinic or apyrimidinic site) lyase [Chloroflexota bacterium]|nr:bifunctional DNA-formamidopyrimidine glycosylase/DNA-(apurinic or apyrimidinic site) lyase [Chloroflexota bacterium]
MPELPEVETMVRDLSPRLTGRRVTAVEAPFTGSVRYPDYPELVDRLVGQEITGVSRRGKYAIFSLASGDALILHRGMTGSVLARERSDPMEQWVRILFRLDDGTELRFQDSRKFGKVFLMEENGAERPLPWNRMGPEPLDSDFSEDALQRRLEGRTALIKPLLLNQEIVAGLGNIYADEALFLAAIHPERRANTLTAEEMTRLYRAIRTVLRNAVEGRGTTFSAYKDIEGRAGSYQGSLQVFHRTGEPCPRCGTAIMRTVVGGRGTHFCPTCQPR